MQLDLFPGPLPVVTMTIPTLTKRHQRKPNSKAKQRRKPNAAQG
jgi:hypothetical protein